MNKKNEINKIKAIIAKTHIGCRFGITDMYQDRYAEAIFNAGYGNITELKAENERLTKQLAVANRAIENMCMEQEDNRREWEASNVVLGGTWYSHCGRDDNQVKHLITHIIRQAQNELEDIK